MPAIPPEDLRRLAAELGVVCAESEAALAELGRLVRHRRDARITLRDKPALLTRARRISVRAAHSLRRATRRPGRAPAFVRTAPLGVNLAGYLEAESGMGEAARASIRSLEAAGVPLALNNVPSWLRTEDASYRDAFTGAHPHPFNLVHLNADNMGWFAARQGRGYFRDRYTIGYWFWELSRFPEAWLPFFRHVDEVWTATEFVRRAVAHESFVPVVRMPLPIVLPDPPPLGRAHFGIPERPAAFVYVFDVSSQMERKHPFGAIRAFRRAALSPDEAVLVLKFTNSNYDPAAVRRLHEEASGLEVVMLDGYMSREELAALLSACDCYLSPHRSEGFGVTILEAMRLGKPAIATNYSGNADFMTAGNSYPLDYRLATLDRDYGPYRRGAVWADPDLDRAAALIRHVAHHRDEAAARGARARADVERDWNPQVTGAQARARLEAIRRG
jgi:glycosyltransferase involved in cell wall biosynthesis